MDNLKKIKPLKVKALGEEFDVEEKCKKNWKAMEEKGKKTYKKIKGLL